MYSFSESAKEFEMLQGQKLSVEFLRFNVNTNFVTKKVLCDRKRCTARGIPVRREGVLVSCLVGVTPVPRWLMAIHLRSF